MAKVSVIIPVYNVENYLKECLESIINQTLADIEIICVNDGSTDNSFSILNDFAQKDSRIKVINQQNQGQSAARNTAIKAAKGDYIAFVDSDDFISSDFLEKLYTAAIKENADIAAANVIYFEKGKYTKDNHISKQTFKTGIKPITTIERKFKFSKAVVVWNKIYKRELILKTEFPINIKFEDNYYTFAMVFSAEKIILVPSANYFYRINDNSIMANAFQNEVVFDIFKIIDKMDKLIESGFFSADIIDDCKKVLAEFKVNTLYSWSKCIANQFKVEFMNKTREVFLQLDLSANKFIDGKTKKRYNKILKIKEPFFRKLAFFK